MTSTGRPRRETTLNQQSEAVDFIDNRLPAHHPAFVNPPVEYDATVARYVPSSHALVPRTSDEAALASPPTSSVVDHEPGPNTGNTLVARPDWKDTKAMQYWHAVFPTALDRFRSTPAPSGRSKTPYDIRGCEDWDAVLDLLEAARGKYTNADGAVGFLRKTRRKIGDNVTGLSESSKVAAKLAPNDPYSSPILGAVQVLLEAVKTAAKVRNQALGGFDGLVEVFSDVELFLATFPGDVSIRNASVELTVVTLDAVERAIGFFISNEVVKGIKAISFGGSYEAKLVESLDAIKEKSKALMGEATKSHIHEFHAYSLETQKMHRKSLENQNYMLDGVNAIHHLLVDHVKQRDRELEAANRELAHLRVENDRLRSVSPFQSGPWALPPPSPRGHSPSQLAAPLSQEALRSLLGTADADADAAADLHLVLDRREQLPARQRVQAEQIVHAAAFRAWVVSPASAKLLVQWDARPPKTAAGVSPLSVFCATLAQALRARDRFLPLVWFCGVAAEQGPHGGPGAGRALLAGCIDQLLRQFVFDMGLLAGGGLDVAALARGGLAERLGLFRWLMRQLPAAVTVVCIVDGVVLLEREESDDEGLQVVSSLLALCNDGTTAAALKVLFTSTPGPHIIRAAFEDDDLILNVEGLPRLTWAPSEERVVRELGGDLGE